MTLQASPELRLDYSVPLLPEAFDYYHTIPNGDEAVIAHLGRTVLSPAMNEVRERFGIVLTPLAWLEQPTKSSRVPYVLVGPTNPLRLGATTKHYLNSLAIGLGARVNLVSAIPYGLGQDTDDYRARAATVIPAQDKELGINTIFPDTTDGLYYGLRTNSARDVADNIVCETIRLKYDANRIDNPDTQVALQASQNEAAQEITDLSRIFDEYRLWHRSETDGAFLIHTANGWLTTQTKTDKANVTPDNMSLVLGWSERNNSVDFVGKKLPSSDVPEFLVAANYARERLRGHQDIRVVIHFHHNTTTRGGQFPKLKTDKLIEYGRFESGYEIIDNMKHRGDNGLILTEHGVVWLGESVQEFEEYVAQRLHIQKTTI